MSWKRVRRRLRAPFLRAGIESFAWGISHMSYGHMRCAAVWCGGLTWRAKTVRTMIAANIRVAFPEWADEQIDAVARKACRNICLTIFEAVWFSRRPQALRGNLVHFSDAARDVLNDLCNGGGATILLTPHLGNWELGAQIACLSGIRMQAVVHQPKDSPTQDVMNRIRGMNGLQLISDKGAARPMLKALRAGDSVGILIDQNVRPLDGGVFVRFFGLPVTCSRGPAMLARKLGISPVCFACLRRNDGFMVQARNLKRPVQDYATDQEMTQELMTIQEDWIRQYPEQYMWFYKRWRYIARGLSEQEQRRYPFYARRLREHEYPGNSAPSSPVTV